MQSIINEFRFDESTEKLSVYGNFFLQNSPFVMTIGLNNTGDYEVKMKFKDPGCTGVLFEENKDSTVVSKNYHSLTSHVQEIEQKAAKFFDDIHECVEPVWRDVALQVPAKGFII